MADGKWISGLTWQTPTVEAARTVLKARLKLVSHYLPLAVEVADQDIEHVHQLRVATRRAGAALHLFDLCLPTKMGRRANKQLRRLRRAAGEARDWDVFVQMLGSTRLLQSSAAKPVADLLFGYATARRMTAQEHLSTVAARSGPRFEKVREEVLEHLEQPAKIEALAPLGELALARLGDYFRTLDKATATTPTKYEELHQIRILGKRVRYAMELFADCFDTPFRTQLYPALEEAQELLGNITDRHVAAERFNAIRTHTQAYRPIEWPRYQKGLHALIQAQRRWFPKERKRYLAWRPRWQVLLQEFPLEKLALRGERS